MPIDFLLGNEEQLEQAAAKPPKVPFDAQTLDFLAAVADDLRTDSRLEHLPDVMSFAFWCRRSHLMQLKEKYARPGTLRFGRGLTIHFAPGNIPTQFAYTAAAGLLAGNCVLVRLSSRRTRQEELIIRAFQKEITGAFSAFAGRIFFCRYAHSKAVTDALSARCDVRVLWGSDASVQEIRRSPLKAGAIDLPFPARDSAAVFSAGEVCSRTDLTDLCRNFYNDTFLSDQNACSSPHILYWLGTPEERNEAQTRFWHDFGIFLKKTGWQVQEETAVKKYTAALRIAADFEDVTIIRRDNAIVRVLLPRLTKALWSYTQPGGLFLESGGETLSGLLPVLSRTCQTLAVFGIPPAEIRTYLAQHPAAGADRIVPAGHTLDFDLTWDGFDLIEHMSRTVAVLE